MDAMITPKVTQKQAQKHLRLRAKNREEKGEEIACKIEFVFVTNHDRICRLDISCFLSRKYGCARLYPLSLFPCISAMATVLLFMGNYLESLPAFVIYPTSRVGLFIFIEQILFRCFLVSVPWPLFYYLWAIT
jgi:hypothetical protein